MGTKRIKDIKKKYKKEWLLIRVDRLDRATHTPITGRLIAHSPNRDEIYKKSISHKGLTFIDYSEDKLPKGYAIAF